MTVKSYSQIRCEDETISIIAYESGALRKDCGSVESQDEKKEPGEVVSKSL